MKSGVDCDITANPLDLLLLKLAEHTARETLVLAASKHQQHIKCCVRDCKQRANHVIIQFDQLFSSCRVKQHAMVLVH